jgi:hypothetical protein
MHLENGSKTKMQLRVKEMQLELVERKEMQHAPLLYFRNKEMQLAVEFARRLSRYWTVSLQ